MASKVVHLHTRLPMQRSPADAVRLGQQRMHLARLARVHAPARSTVATNPKKNSPSKGIVWKVALFGLALLSSAVVILHNGTSWYAHVSSQVRQSAGAIERGVAKVVASKFSNNVAIDQSTQVSESISLPPYATHGQVQESDQGALETENLFELARVAWQEKKAIPQLLTGAQKTSIEVATPAPTNAQANKPAITLTNALASPQALSMPPDQNLPLQESKRSASSLFEASPQADPQPKKQAANAAADAPGASNKSISDFVIFPVAVDGLVQIQHEGKVKNLRVGQKLPDQRIIVSATVDSGVTAK